MKNNLNIPNNLYKSIVNIKLSETKNTVGFLMKIKKKNYLFIINFILSEDYIKQNKPISIFYYKLNFLTSKNIFLNNSERIIKSFYLGVPITLIKILKCDDIPEDRYLYPDFNYLNDYSFYFNKNISHVKYPINRNYQNINPISYSNIQSINNYEFFHFLDTKESLIGLPIFLNENNFVVGINNKINKNSSHNGIFFGYFIENIDKLENEKATKIKTIENGKGKEIEKEKFENIRSISNYNNYSLDDIIKKDNDYYAFFHFLNINKNSAYFVNYSIFDKSIYSQIKSIFLEKFKKNDLSFLEKACIGSMLGMAIGDAIGARVEFLPLNYHYDKIKDMGQFPAGKFNLNPGQWTDDTSMGLCIADSLIENNGNFDPKDIMMRFILWWTCGYNNAFRFDNNRNNKHSVGLGGNISGSFQDYLNNKGKYDYTKF